jgi:glycosyltransferase involved in cell wall biosynthesis
LIDGVMPVLRNSHGIESVVIASRSLNERPRRFWDGDHEVVSIDVPHRYSPNSVLARGARLMSECRHALDYLHLDLLHIHGIWHLFAPMTMVGRARGVPMIHHVHGELLPTTKESSRRILRDSESVLAVSQPVAESVARVAARTRPIDVVANGLPDIAVPATSGDPPTLGLVGRLEGPKGFHQGLQAFADLSGEFPDLELSIVGVGEDLIPLQRVASRLGIANRVTFHGRLVPEETIAVMARCSVVVVPSLSMEGFSLVAAEAALLGKPVVSYRVGGLQETVQDGVTGILVEVGQVDQLTGALRGYLRNPVLREHHGAAGRSRALNLYGLDRFASDLANRYITIGGIHGRATLNEGVRDLT